MLFNTRENAAANFGQQYNGKSIKQGVEYATNIYKKEAKDGKTYYYYEDPNKGNKSSASLPSTFLNEGERTSYIHTHGDSTADEKVKYDDNNFSPADKKVAQENDINGYVVTPNGSLKKYDAITSKTNIVSTNMPSDPNDPQRKNTVSPIENPAPVKTKPIEPKKVEVKKTGQIEYHHGRIM